MSLNQVLVFSQNDMLKNKLNEIYEDVKEATLDDQADIVENSTSDADCIATMHATVDEHAVEFVKIDEFLKEVPVETMDKLKSDLEPLFKKAYNQRKVNHCWEYNDCFCLFGVIGEAWAVSFWIH